MILVLVLVLGAVTVTVMHLSMLSPRGGPLAYVRHLTSIAFSNLGNLTKNLGPRVGRLECFFCTEEWDQVTSSHVPWFPFRKRSIPFLTVNGLIGNQAFQNGWCYICFSLGLQKVETSYNLSMELQCTHQMLNFSYSHWFASSLFLFIVSGNSIINS